jgi:hypothetical protein
VEDVSSTGLAHWAVKIQGTLSSGKASTIRLAKVVFEAKCQSPYGHWTQLWRLSLLPFSKRKGEILAASAQAWHKGIAGGKHWERQEASGAAAGEVGNGVPEPR